ncbi:hypothetical protein BDW72DRAFT_187638, partial [Aspergillus terricola var. indicus]
MGPGGGKLITFQRIFGNTAKCRMILKNLNNKISAESTQSSARRLRLRHWKWPLQCTEVDEAISQLKGYTSLLVIALQIDHVWVI